MSDKRGRGDDDLNRGVIFLSKDEWFDLQIFALISMHRNPTTEEKMAVALGLTGEDKKKHWDPDFTATVADYKKLASSCDEFWNHTRPGMVDLVNDIFQYQSKMDTFFKRLIETIDNYDAGSDVDAKLAKLWQEWTSEAPSQEAIKVKDRFITAVSRLQSDAVSRRDKADALKKDMDAFHSDLVESGETFTRNQKNFENKYGVTSQAMKDLEKRLAGLNAELASYRKKEKDEIIVLSTSPVYLILWPIGPLIMAGVQIGVGVDLALLRAKIDTLVGDVADEQNLLDSKKKFGSSYKFIKDYTDDTRKQIVKILPAVAALKDGWTTIAADLQGLVDLLNAASGDAKKEEWFGFASSLDTARDRWKFLAARADNFRLHATVREVPNIDEFLKAAQKVA